MSDIVERMRELAATKSGEMPPAWFPHINWGDAMSALLNEAADEIERLRALVGAASAGLSLADIKQTLKSSDA